MASANTSDAPAGDSGRAPAISALGLLGDGANRLVLTTLGAARGRPVPTSSINERFPASTTPRFVRDRIRFLTRNGLVRPAPTTRDAPEASSRWTLTAAGDEAVSLLSLMSRIAAHGADVDATAPAVLRERALGDALGAFADPVIVAALKILTAHGPLDPTELEVRCDPIPRRTLYRRLDTLVSIGAVLRTTTRRVPRSTEYAVADRWRPTVAIMLLGAWWDSRHPELTGGNVELDLAGLIVAVAPSIRVAAGHDGRQVRLGDGSADGHRIVLRIDLTAVSVGAPFNDLPGTAATRIDAELHGETAAWTAAIVNDRRALLNIDGDAELAGAMLTAIRTALLNYIR